MSHFDYENAERDIFDAGGDPDYLSHYNEAARDRYLKGMGLNPRSYGGGRTADPKSRSAGVSKSRRAGVPQYSSSDAQADYSWSSSGMSSSQWRQSKKEQRDNRNLEKYKNVTLEEFEEEYNARRAFVILTVLAFLFAGIYVILYNIDISYSLREKLFTIAALLFIFTFFVVYLWPDIKQAIAEQKGKKLTIADVVVPLVIVGIAGFLIFYSAVLQPKMLKQQQDEMFNQAEELLLEGDYQEANKYLVGKNHLFHYGDNEEELYKWRKYQTYCEYVKALQEEELGNTFGAYLKITDCDPELMGRLQEKYLADKERITQERSDA